MYNQNELVTKIKELEKKDEQEKIELMLEEMLKQDPKNIDLWMRLAILELDTPFYDEEKSIECIEEILKIEKDNPIALLMLAYVKFLRFGTIDEAFMKKLCIIQTGSAEINSMLRYVASWFYKIENPVRQEQLLKESINYYQEHVWNYVDLADLYFVQGQNTEAKEFLKKALKNVRKVYKIEDWDPDPTDANELLYEFFNGLELTTDQLEDIKRKLDQ